MIAAYERKKKRVVGRRGGGGGGGFVATRRVEEGRGGGGVATTGGGGGGRLSVQVPPLLNSFPFSSHPPVHKFGEKDRERATKRKGKTTEIDSGELRGRRRPPRLSLFSASSHGERARGERGRLAYWHRIGPLLFFFSTSTAG